MLTPPITLNNYIGTGVIFGTEDMMRDFHVAIADFKDLYADQPMTVLSFI